jgi:hypothetical protein
MKRMIMLSVFATLGVVGADATDATIEQMPPKLETQYALSALPPAMRDQATVYLLDPKSSYQLTRQGASGVTCLVERTAWEQADFRNDIYVPLCYDAAGSKTYLKVIMDAAALRIQGLNPAALKAEIEKRYKDTTYKAPDTPGVSYMVAPVMRTWMLPDWHVHTMPMQHLMFYAPNLTDQDIGSGYSRYLGISEADFIQSMPSPPTPSDVTTAVIELVTKPDRKESVFVISGKGLEAVTS